MLALKQIFANVKMKKKKEPENMKDHQRRKSIFEIIRKHKDKRQLEKIEREKQKSKKSSLVLDATFQT